MNTNAVIFVLLLVALIFVVLALPQVNLNSVTSSSNSKSTPIEFEDYVCLTTTGATADNPTHGTEKDLGCVQNLVTNAGLGELGNVLNGTHLTLNATWIALGNAGAGYPLPTDASINGEWNTCGLSNATGTSVGQAQGAWNVTKTFTSTCANSVVNITGLYNSSKYGTGGPVYTGLTPLLFAEANFTMTTLQVNDMINVTWGVYITTSG